MEKSRRGRDETLILVKLRAQVAGMADDDSDAIAAAYGASAHGMATRALKVASTAQGANTIATGVASSAQGIGNIAIGTASTAQGYDTMAGGLAATAQGISTRAIETAALAEGEGTTASGKAAHAEGIDTMASGQASHAEGCATDTAGQEGAHIMGRYGQARFPYSWHLANGTDQSNPGLAAIIRKDGQGIADLGWVTGNADFAEMFETLSGESIAPGYFVTLVNDKIRKANCRDKFILGVTSAAPAFLGDAEDLRWKNKYIKDEWGRIKYHKVVIPEQYDENGRITMSKRTEMQPVIDPRWRPSEEYVPRSVRPEWAAVAAIGKVFVRDDGTCQADGYCMPNDEGAATASPTGYRVMKRTGPRQVLVWMK